MNDAQHSCSLDNRSSTARPRAAAICCGIVGLVFLFSAGAKLSAVGAFEIQLVKQGLFASRELAMWPSRVLVAAELFAGIGLLQPVARRRFFVPLAAAMLTAFSIWLIWLLISGSKIEDCGCFGELLKISPRVALIRNFVLLGLIVVPWRWLTVRRGVVVPLGAMAVAIVATALLAPPKAPPVEQAGDVGPAIAVPSPFAVFTTFSDGPVDLTAGTQLVAFLSLDCEHCRDLAGQLARMPQLPPLHVLYLGDAGQVADFEGMSGSGFPWMIPPAGQFFDFIGDHPPRVYLLVNGEVRARWDEGEFSFQALKVALP